MSGRPLRFLAGVGAGWIGLRVLMLWPEADALPDVLREVLPLPTSARASATLPMAGPASRQIARGRHGHRPKPKANVARRDHAQDPSVRASQRPPLVAPVAPIPVESGLTIAAGSADGVLVPPPRAPTPFKRLTISAWGIARGGRGLGASADAPQLGGTQGGIRIDYAIVRGVAATARIAAPAAGAGREVAIGVAWRPDTVPLRLVAEYRIGLDGIGSGPAVGVSGGVSAVPLPAGFRLEGFAQAGAIRRDRTELYVDGSVRAARPLAAVGSVTIDAGIGAWGGAQHGVGRFDIGPSIGARVPVADGALRVSLDWRQRVAGNARPGSGPALTVGADF